MSFGFCLARRFRLLLRVVLAAGLLAGAMGFASRAVSLDGTWRVTRLGLGAEGVAGLGEFRHGGKTIEARVPGDVHLDLVRAGEMGDPSVSDNSRKDRWPERYSWWYRTTFTPPQGFRQEEQQELVFDGLFYNAEVFLNGELVGSNRNSLVPARFDVTGRLREGENEVVVRLTSGYELIGEVDQDFSGKGLYKNRENFPARQALRTAPYQWGGIGMTRCRISASGAAFGWMAIPPPGLITYTWIP